MEARSAHFVWFALTFSPLLYKLTVLLFLWGFFVFALLCFSFYFKCSASFAVCLLSFYKQKKNKKNKMSAWVHLVLLWNVIWSPECQPVPGCHLCHSLSQRYGAGASPSAAHSSFHIHPSASEMGKKCPKRPVPLTAPRFLRKTFG